MPNPLLPEDDDAALYVMGALRPEEKRNFEARLAESESLRSLVREMEEGSLAAALASPRREPPDRIWKKIEKTVAKENRGRAAIPIRLAEWCRSGWVAVAACLAGFILFALWQKTNAPGEGTEMSQKSEPVVRATPGGGLQKAGETSLVQNARAESHAPEKLLQARAEEVRSLQQQIAGLETRLARLSHSLTQTHARLGESSRLKFFQLKPVSATGVVGTNRSISPALQQAIFLAIGRELGWLPAAPEFVDSTGTNQLKVDFVDLRPEAEEKAVQQEARPEARRNLANTPPLNPAAPNVQSDAVPAFVSGDDVIVAIDPSVAAPGSQLTFWDETGSEALGSATIGEDPLVVKFAARSFTGHSGTGLLITAEEPSGASGLIQLQPQEISEP